MTKGTKFEYIDLILLIMNQFSIKLESCSGLIFTFDNDRKCMYSLHIYLKLSSSDGPWLLYSVFRLGDHLVGRWNRTGVRPWVGVPGLLKICFIETATSLKTKRETKFD